MKIAAKQLLGLLPRLLKLNAFPLPLYATSSNQEVAFLEASELEKLAKEGAIYGVGTRRVLKCLRFTTPEAEEQYMSEHTDQSSPASRAIPAVDLIRGDSGHGSYVMRRLLDDGRLVRPPEFKRAA